MRTLPEFLGLAISHGAAQIVLETGQPPLLAVGTGNEPAGHVIAEAELFAILEAQLSDDQQVELAVGNVVVFEISHEGSEWTFEADPRAQGIVLRGRCAAAQAPAAGPPGASSAVSQGIELPPMELGEHEDDEGAPAATSGSRWPQFEVPVDTGEIDLGALEDSGTQPPVWPSGLAAEPPGATAPPAGTAGPQVVEGSTPAAGGLEPPSAATAPPLNMPHGAGAPGRAAGDPELDRVTRKDLPVDISTAVDSGGGAEPPREHGRAPVTDEEFRTHAQFVEPGTLVFLRAAGYGPAVAEALGAPCVVVEAKTGTRTWRALGEAPADGCVVVVRDPDPSRHLAAVLRALEEGARVVVETRARTPDGARRVLLGVQATDRAERWLDAHPRRWIERCDDGWRGQ